MKTFRFILTAIVASVSIAATAADNNIVPDKPIQIMGGPGIAISGSATVNQLPAAAQSFLNKNYAGTAITKCTQNYVKETSDVILADGTKIEFDKKGKVKDITSGNEMPLSESVLIDVLPEKTVIHLAQIGAMGDVYSIKNAEGRGTIVMFLNNVPPQMIYDVDGVFVITAG